MLKENLPHEGNPIIVSVNKETEDGEIKEINKELENFNFEGAKKMLLDKLKREPKNVEVLDTLSEVCLSLDQSKEAIKVVFS